MTFQQINQEISDAQAILEQTIHKTIEAEELLDKAKIQLIQVESVKKKARLEQKLAQERLQSLREQAWNLRQESKNL